jgi:hypothetical protein
VVIILLEGLDKPESVATGWVKDFDSAKVEIIGHLVQGLSDYLNADHSEKDSEADTEIIGHLVQGLNDYLNADHSERDWEVMPLRFFPISHMPYGGWGGGVISDLGSKEI